MSTGTTPALPTRYLTNTTQGPPCPECQCPDTIPKGKRRNRMRSLQVYQCRECLHRFTLGDAPVLADCIEAHANPDGDLKTKVKRDTNFDTNGA